MQKPYIGVTGITRPEETLIRTIPMQPTRQLAIGILVSYRTIRRIPFTGRWERWKKQFPPFNKIAGLVSLDAQVCNIAHYCPESGHESSLSADLIRIGETYPALNGFQINWPWPEIRLLDEYRVATSWSFRLILQINQQAIDQAGSTPRALADMLYHYAGTIDDVLLDLSNGEGKPLDPKKLLPYLRTIQSRGWDLGLGVAGGLCADNLHLVEPLLEEFPDLSFDAHRRLRDAHDKLDLKEAGRYLEWAVELTTKVRA